MRITAKHCFVEGLAPCLAGANNGALLVYARFGDGWRKVSDETGQRLHRLATKRHGWRDLELWQHDSAFQSIRYVYQFDGKEYRAIRCNVVQFADALTTTAFPKPIYNPCTWDWRESKLIPEPGGGGRPAAPGLSAAIRRVACYSFQ